LTPGGDAVGKIEIGAIQTVIANGFENQLTLYCDLDSLRVEAIERRRAGKEPVLFLQMWPILFDGQRPLGAPQRRTRRSERPTATYRRRGRISTEEITTRLFCRADMQWRQLRKYFRMSKRTKIR